MAHTPGPWKVADRFYILMDDDVACEVAKVCDENIDEDSLGQCDADARLIAAAPELLRELKFAVSVLQDNHIARGVAAALAAIRSAEGRSD